MATTAAVDGSVFTDDVRFADIETWHRDVGELRRSNPFPLVESEGFPSFWVATKHADVLEIERSPEIFQNTMHVQVLSLKAEAMADAPGGSAETLVHMDGPKHGTYRNVTAPYFRPAYLRKKMSATVDSIMNEYIDKLAANPTRECDFASDVAVYAPLRTLMGILGIAERDMPLMLDLTQRVMAPGDPEYTLTGDAAEDHAKTVTEVFGYFGALAEARRQNPTEDLASIIANGTIDGQPLGDFETLSYYLILAAAGHDTTSMTMASTVAALAENPDQFRLLKQKPELINNAVEEMIRWSSPVVQFVRTATQDYEIRGNAMKAGDRVILSFLSANRDEEVFDDPFTFDIERPNANLHLGFGSGAHFCLGSPLARMQLASFFRQFTARVKSVELTGPVERTAGTTNSGPKHVPIRFELED